MEWILTQNDRTESRVASQLSDEQCVVGLEHDILIVWERNCSHGK